jgi:hypothetical protein
VRLVPLGPASGKFTDIVADPLGWLVCYQDEADGAIVLVQLHPNGDRRVPDVRIEAGGGNAFPVLCVEGRDSWLAFRHGLSLHGILRNLTTGRWYDLGIVHGNSPIAFGAGFCAYQATAGYAVQARSLPMPDHVVRSSHVGRPTGLAGNTADGPILVDDLRASVPGMANPRTAGGCTVGENTDDGQSRNIARLEDGREVVLWAGLDSFTPHIAFASGVWAVATWGAPTGVRMALLEPADFAAPKPPDPKPEPPAPDPNRWTVVPHGTLVTGALRVLLGDHPNQQGDIICLNKNTHPEAEWRKRVAGRLYHWADASRFPGDRGWWIEPAPLWVVDAFASGSEFDTENATLVDFHNNTTNRWRQTNTLYGTVGGGVLVQFDPRFPGQYTDMSKQGTPAWAPAGYEKQWVLPDGSAKWQYIVTPLAAKGRIPWGDPSMDVVIQKAENGPRTGPATPQPFIPCPRPLTTTPAPQPNPTDPPEPPPMPDTKPDLRGIPRDQIALMADAIDLYLRENPRLGLGDGLLTPDAGDRPLSHALDAVYAYLLAECLGAFQAGGPLPGDAAGYDQRRDAALAHTFHVIEQERGTGPKPKPQPGPAAAKPIGVSGRDFITP